MSGLPSGTVTLLFTDVEGSTRLWDAERDAMAAALRRHDEILRGAIEQAGGYVFKTAGDSFCAAFPAARAGLDAALAAQRDLAAQSWPTSRPIVVRMALHAGVCEAWMVPRRMEIEVGSGTVCARPARGAWWRALWRRVLHPRRGQGGTGPAPAG